YGSKEWNIVHIFRYYRGYYTGEVRDLFPQTTQSEAQMSAFLAEGDGDLASKAQAALDINPAWALRLADDALLLDPDNPVAFETKKAAMLTLAENTMNSQARNMLLSDYLLMTDQTRRPYAFDDPKLVFSRIDDKFVELMPMATLHRILSVSLNASKSMEKDIIVSLQLTDIKMNDPKMPDHYTLNVRKGILEVDPPSASNDQFEIVTDSLTWKQLVLSKINPEDAVLNGKLDISGGTPESFYSFMELFN
ncbi:MAG: alkyl sulfatase, partial [Chloroflexi bacterium]|nr:alkyl sulfatase [Chloroflexota bacterium]